MTLLAYPLALIRLCQFHVVQAITRLERDSGDRGSPMRLGVELKAEIIYHFRRLQRCRTMEDWPETEKAFFRNVQRAIVMQGRKENDENQTTSAADMKRYQEQYDFVYQYFKVNWFTDHWIREWHSRVEEPDTERPQRPSLTLVYLTVKLATELGTRTTGSNARSGHSMPFSWNTVRTRG